MSHSCEGIVEAFANFASYMEQESQLKENIGVIVKSLEKCAYVAFTTLEKVHHTQGLQNIDTVCKNAENDLKEVPSHYEKLSTTIPAGEFYKFHHQFRHATQKLVHACVFISYLQKARLLSYEEVAAKLGLKTDRLQGFPLDLEDYLIGSLSIGHDLGRLSVNSVSAGDYEKPFQISQFLRDLHASYSLLNPKHELRKRFDELKYSVKKSEEVVYNLSLRGLNPQESDKSG